MNILKINEVIQLYISNHFSMYRFRRNPTNPNSLFDYKPIFVEKSRQTIHRKPGIFHPV
jgi:hypothetical protein